MKTLQKNGHRRNLPNMVKAIYDKPTANIVLSGEKLKVFPLRSGTKQGCPLSPLLLNILLKALATAIREEREIKGIQIKKEVKLSRFADDMTLYIENSKASIRKSQELMSVLSKVAGYQIHTQKPLAFLYTNKKNQKKKLRNHIHLPL